MLKSIKEFECNDELLRDFWRELKGVATRIGEALTPRIMPPTFMVQA